MTYRIPPHRATQNADLEWFAVLDRGRGLDLTTNRSTKSVLYRTYKPLLVFDHGDAKNSNETQYINVCIQERGEGE